jgi:hypothetical protein
LVHAATTDEKILATLSDDDLAGVITAVRRIASFAAWAEMTAIREFATRPDPRRAAPSGPGSGGAAGGRSRGRGKVGPDPGAAVAGLPGHPKVREFAADELAPDLHVTWQSAADQITYACTVAARLPVTFAALRAGMIHAVHLRIAEDETAYLAEKFLAEADEKLAAAAQSKTFGEFRYYAHRLVLKLDPDSALRRKNEARKDAHVRPFREASGNAGMSARELPPRPGPRLVAACGPAGPGPARGRHPRNLETAPGDGLPRPLAGTRLPHHPARPRPRPPPRQPRPPR